MGGAYRLAAALSYSPPGVTFPKGGSVYLSFITLPAKRGGQHHALLFLNPKTSNYRTSRSFLFPLTAFFCCSTFSLLLCWTSIIFLLRQPKSQNQPTKRKPLETRIISFFPKQGKNSLVEARSAAAARSPR